MGWVKKEVNTDEKLFNEVKECVNDKFAIIRGVRKSCSGSVYEYLTDFLRDYYDVTLYQSHRVAKRLADHYGIKQFYHHN